MKLGCLVMNKEGKRKIKLFSFLSVYILRWLFNVSVVRSVLFSRSTTKDGFHVYWSEACETSKKNNFQKVPCLQGTNQCRIMYELAVCSDGMTEAQPRSFRQNRPASEYISDIMHTPLLTSAAVVRTRAPEYEKKCCLIIIMQHSQDKFRFLP